MLFTMPSVIRHSSQVIHSPFFKNILKQEHDSFKSKSISSWEISDTLAWIASTATENQIDVEDVKMLGFKIKGQELLTMAEMDFSRIDTKYGYFIFTQLEIYKCENKNKIYAQEPPKQEIIITEEPIKRRPGRPKSAAPKKKQENSKRLWAFIRDLLLDPKTCPSLIRWTDYSNLKFQFVDSKQVAEMWGMRKTNEKMTYEKFSRAMRYYYKTKILLPVEGQRLVYAFGTNATGLETDDPNFVKRSNSADVKHFVKESSVYEYINSHAR